MRYVEELLEDETMLRKVFESDLVVAIDSSHSLIQTTIRETPKSSITFEEFASPWWHCIGEPTIKGKIIGGIAKDVSICYDTSPNGLDRLPPEAAMAYAHRIISTAYFAKWVEGMPVIEPEKEDLAED